MKIRRRHAVYASLIIIVILAVGYVLSSRQGRSLDSRFIPTAEALIAKPLSKPEFIGNMRPIPGQSMSQGGEICIQIFPGEMMKPGDSYQDLKYHVWRNTSLIINNYPLPLFTPITIQATAWLREVVDGQATGEVTFCFTPDLEIGTHMATLLTSDLSNQEYSYTWAFRVE